MAWVSLTGSKVILIVCNFFLLVCGITLITGGLLVIFDPERVLLSRLLSNGAITTLRQPLFYYVALGLITLGLILAITGVLGCWASCYHNYCLLSVYFIVILIVLVAECVIYTTVWMWPQCLGIVLDPEFLTKSIQKNYGSSGQEQMTAAVDFAQTTFNCCGVESANEYDMSLWRLQSLSHSLAVPLTCCKLRNINDTKAYLNPDPLNVTLCQALELTRHEDYRHLKGCKDELEHWFAKHYVIFLGVGLAAVLIEFMVLLSTILTCTRIYQHHQETKENERNKLTFVRSDKLADRRLANAYSNETYAMSDNYKQNYKRMDQA